VGGAGAYAAAGAVIAVGAGLSEAVRRQLPEAVRADAQFEEATSPASYGMGATRIDVYPVPNEHADGSIMSFLPGSGTLFQGDLFYIPERR
jgi:flavorubredoxin